MAGKKAAEVKAFVTDAVRRLAHVRPNAKIDFEDLRFDETLREAVGPLTTELARKRGVVLEPVKDASGLASAKTLDELASNFRAVGTVTKVSASLKPSVLAGSYPASAATRDVATVIGIFKNISPNSIAASDKLERWYFTLMEKRAIAQAINLYYFNKLQLVMNPWIHPSETADATLVADLIKVVLKHNPHRPKESPSGSFAVAWRDSPGVPV